MHTFSKRSFDNLQGVHPELVRVMAAAIVDCPIDFTITEGVRTTERQMELYAQGRTGPGPRVTNADGIRNKSNHQVKSDGYGHAVDLYPFVEGKVQVTGPLVGTWLHTIANHIKITAARLSVRIEWGGDWKSPFDPPHFEVYPKVDKP